MPALASLEAGAIGHGELLTTNEEMSSVEFPMPVSGLTSQTMGTNNGSQWDVDMEIPNQNFDDFWYWLGDFGNDMQGVYYSLDSQSDGPRHNSDAFYTDNTDGEDTDAGGSSANPIFSPISRRDTFGRRPTPSSSAPFNSFIKENRTIIIQT